MMERCQRRRQHYSQPPAVRTLVFCLSTIITTAPLLSHAFSVQPTSSSHNIKINNPPSPTLHPSIPKENTNEQQQQQHSDSILYADLQRVVKNHTFPSLAEQRSKKPIVLSSDVEGALRCCAMIRTWRHNRRPPLQAYEFCFATLLRRGRIRWYTNNHHKKQGGRQQQQQTQCIVDVMEQVWEWIRQDYDPVPESLRLQLLQAYALSATPRQKKQYAQAAHTLFRAYPYDDQSTQQQAAYHVLHAYCWQQGNKMKGDSCAAVAEQLYREYNLQGMGNATQFLIEAWSKADNGAERCQAHYDTLAHPDEDSRLNLILAWSRKDALVAAERFATCFPDGHDAPPMATNTVSSVLAREGHYEKAEELLRKQHHVQSTRSYNSLMANMLRMPRDGQERLKEIQRIAHQVKEPNAFTYYTLLKAHQQAKTGSSECKRLLDKILYLRNRGDTSTKDVEVQVMYNLVLAVYAHNRDAPLALELWDTMTQPDCVSYTTMLQCLAASRVPVQEDTVRQLLEACPDPSIRTYTMAIQCLANHQLSPSLARTWLLQANAGTNSYPYNYVLKCCAAASDTEAAFQIAAETFRDLQGFRDSFSYAYWLQCCERLLKKSNEDEEFALKCVRLAMDQAKQDGFFHPVLLRRLHHSFPASFTQQVLGCDAKDKTIADFPASWSRKSDVKQ